MSDTDPLRRQVYARDAYKAFGDFTLADVEARARELQATSGFGPTARVASVARVWAELARTMSESGAATVSHLDGKTAREFAQRAWVLPPGGSLL